MDGLFFGEAVPMCQGHMGEAGVTVVTLKK